MRGKTRGRARRVATTVGRWVLVASIGAGAVASAQDAGEEYVRARDDAKVYNYQDYRAKIVVEPEPGALLRVLQRHEYEIQGRELTWLEVQAPGGMPVWVHGKYLAETGAPKVMRVTATAVRMRPLPESSVASFPLTSTLDTGTRVEFIERANPSKPLAEDWVKVWALDAVGYVALETVDAEPDLAAARAEWQRSVRALPDVPSRPAAGSNSGSNPGAKPPAAGTREASAGQDAGAPKAAATRAAGSTSIPEEAYRSLAYGRTLFDNAIKKGKGAVEADFDPAIRAFRIVLDMVPEDSQVADSARDAMGKAEAHQTLAATREDLRSAELKRQEWLEELRREQEKDELADSVNWGRFAGRGWVESVKQGREKRWFLRWSGKVTYEVTCQSGRYDLSQYEGYEIGVLGSVLRQRVTPTEETPEQEALLEVTRIEVISGSPRR